MKKVFFLLVLILSLFSFSLCPGPVLADKESTSGASMTLTNPLGTGTTVYTLVGRIISVVLGLVGTIALVMFIYGGIIWMTSAGSKDKVKKGKDAIVWSVIGMAVIFASYGLTKFLLDNLTGR